MIDLEGTWVDKMKKLFNQSKRPYEAFEEYDELAEYESGELDWDADYTEDVEETYTDDLDGYYGEDGNYYVQGEDGAYYVLGEDGQYYLVEEYYAEENVDENEPSETSVEESYFEEEYYQAMEEEDADSQDVEIEVESMSDEFGDDVQEPELYIEVDGTYYMLYDDGEYYPIEAEEYYAAMEENGYYSSESAQYYADEEDAYYQESVEYDEEPYYEDNRYSRKTPVYYEETRENIFTKFWNAFLDMEAMDKIIATTGVAVLLLLLVGGGIFLSVKSAQSKQVSVLAEVGTQLEGIGTIGEQGLLAVADAQKGRIEAANALKAEEEQNKEYNETDYSKSVVVSMNTVSVQKDLKIKFINKSTEKLISNVPFSVTITTPDDKTEVWSDDDMDGIIYKKGIKSGNYKVAMDKLDDEKYKNYTISGEVKAVVVREEIEYKKVDVSGEVKKESEINVAKEDTKKKETVVESVLEDTVTWVESTSVANTYVEVGKDTVPDPTLLAKAGTFMRTASVSGNNATTTTPLGAITLDKSASTVYTTLTDAINASIANAGPNAVVTAESSDTNVATVAVNGKTVTVTGVGAGSVTITVKCTQNGQEVKATCAVTVKQHPSQDTTTKLKDTSGNQLYVLEGDTYREAVYADYYTADKFYIKGQVKYTGWQTLNGKVYFYDASGKKVTGDQVIQGAKYTFDSEGALVTSDGVMGIDVSKWNGNIDWEAVKNSGVAYVIIRCGYRGSSQGSLIEDPKFEQNIKGATNAGIKVGVYFFTQAIDESEAIYEASYVLEQVENYRITLPIFLDVEASGGRGDKIDKATRTAVCKAFCKTIEDADKGYKAGIYANKTWLTQKINASELENYKIWLAQYAAEPTYTGKYDMWQYTESGKISGISGNVDLNISYMGY